MHLRNSLLFLAALPAFAGNHFTYRVLGEDPGSWPSLLSSVGLLEDANDTAGILVVPAHSSAPPDQWTARVDHGAILILEGESALASAFGFKPSARPRVSVRSVEDIHAPKLRIIWEKPLDVAAFDLPKEARVFAAERWNRAPLIAGFRRGEGAVLWVAASPGTKPYDRFPFLAHALTDLGFDPPFGTSHLWAFFDSSYRSRIDPDYFASRWRAAGISALHVAAWHYWEPDPQADQYLRELIDACHKQAIAVYAWIELPHVSEKFWNDHPEWREKTALLQDAQLDWRKLINLTNRAAFQSAAAGLRDLTRRFDWDGINLAELYFESLEGVDNPARFTPMNDDVRAAFRAVSGFDPVELFDPRSQHYYSNDTAGLMKFLDFRAELARRQQSEWLDQIDSIRRAAPHLDLTLTHVDDRFDPSMREKIGADASRVLPMLSDHDFTFLIEDPATIWNLGPQRYPQIAARYHPLTPQRNKLAMDINIVERYQDVYPTKQQTGLELFDLVHTASAAFPRVALYFENSISRVDWPLLAASASNVTRVQHSGSKLLIDSVHGVSVPWQGPATVDGRLWPFADQGRITIPAGLHSIEAAQSAPPIRILDLNAELKSATASAAAIEFAYQSSARAMARLDTTPVHLEIDGAEAAAEMHGSVLILPRGQHLVRLSR
jgi:hypothetical protein